MNEQDLLEKVEALEKRVAELEGKAQAQPDEYVMKRLFERVLQLEADEQMLIELSLAARDERWLYVASSLRKRLI